MIAHDETKPYLEDRTKIERCSKCPNTSDTDWILLFVINGEKVWLCVSCAQENNK